MSLDPGRIAPIAGGLVAALVAGLALDAQAQVTRPDNIPGGVYNTVAPSLSNLQVAPNQMDSAGNLKITGTVVSGGGSVTITAGSVTAIAPYGSAAQATSQIAVTSTAAAAIATASTSYVLSEVCNEASSAKPIYIGNTAVSATGGIAIAPGACFNFSQSPGAWSAITSAGAASADGVRY